MRSRRLQNLGSGVATQIADINETAIKKREYKVGDTGPAGGVIFFVDYLDQYPDFTYLEACPFDAANNLNRLTIQSARVLGDDVEYSLDAVPSNMPIYLASASVRNMPQAFNFEKKTIEFSGDLRIQPKVVLAEVSGPNIVYTTSEPHKITVGTLVTTTVFSPAQFNVSNRVVLAVTPTTFTVENTGGASGSATGGGRVGTNRFTVPNTMGATGSVTGPFVDAVSSSTSSWHNITNNWLGCADWENHGIAAGRLNTDIMLASATTGAAKVAQDFEFGGYSDWVLPSIGALMLMDRELRTLGKGFEPIHGAQYWSSTENTPTNAWIWTADRAFKESGAKGNSLRVKLIRAF